MKMRSIDLEAKNLLRSVIPAPAPPGLREKLLKAASAARRADSPATPLLRICLAGCAVTLLVVSLADALASKDESSRFRAIRGTPLPNHEVSSPITLAEYSDDPLLDELNAGWYPLYTDGKGEMRSYRDLLNMEKRILLEEYDGD